MCIRDRFSDPVGGDHLRGDEGVDTLDLRTRTGDLVISVGVGVADDGEAGEGDQVSSEIEIVLAGSGNDVIEDNTDIENRFDGGPGNDTLFPHRGTDTMIGGEGVDTLSHAPHGLARIYFRVGIDVLAGKGVNRSASSPPMDTTFSEFERFIGGEAALRFT